MGKPLDVAKEAKRWMRQRAAENGGMSRKEMLEMVPLAVIGAEINSRQLEAFARRLLRLAAGECDGVCAELRERTCVIGEKPELLWQAIGARDCASHLRALARPPRRRGK